MADRKLGIRVTLEIVDTTTSYSHQGVAKVSLETNAASTIEAAKKELHRLSDVALEAADASIRAKIKQETEVAEAEAAANK